MFGGYVMVVNIEWDNDVKVWIATCDSIGLVLESDSYDVLIDRIKLAVPELIELNGLATVSEVTLSTKNRQITCA